ncbi:MAG: hypothetical protein IJ600_03500 [Lachnospiraceae bacterium]|nr:hypothetical protein [Lachnospiraceae bacterium]
MIEKTILDYLNSVMTVPAFMEEPEEPPAEYLRIEKQGSGYTDHVKSAVITVQSYGSSMYRAAEINAQVVGAMLQAVELNGITRSALNSDYCFTDEATHRHRYQAVFDIVYF